MIKDKICLVTMIRWASTVAGENGVSWKKAIVGLPENKEEK